MRNTRSFVAPIVALVGFSPGSAFAQEASLPATVSAEAAFHTRYLFAGIPFALDEVAQAKLTVGRGPFTFNAFSVYGVEESDVIEADVWGDYYAQISPLVGGFVGLALYNFKIGGIWEATPEVYGGVTVAVPLQPTLYMAHDFDLGDGSHVLFSLSHSVPLGASGASLGAAASVDYNDDYYVAGSSFGYADLVLSAGLPAGAITFTPMFRVQRALDDDRFQDFEVGGLTIDVTF